VRRARAKINYWRRIVPAYLGRGASQLTFWHDQPTINERAFDHALGEYYQDFSQKANYPGSYDHSGIPLLDYRGRIGPQYNPIAVAQYGLGNHMLYRRGGGAERQAAFLRAADWLVEHLEVNAYGLKVWQHHFDWEYREGLKAPWYSGLAQGQGVSLLARAYYETGAKRYVEAAEAAYIPLTLEIEKGGVAYRDAESYWWLEEYLTAPPTHILNGFLWATWGVHDYAHLTQREEVGRFFENLVGTLTRNLPRYDTGYWSLYELGDTWLPMVTSPFYHRLHVIQLRIMGRITREPRFEEMASRWEAYLRNPLKRRLALAQKIIFKILYY
jgi:heparosan-N-sulfate-glucuronate 5-epimerase